MSEKDLIFFLGIAFGFVAGFAFGHGRGQIAGIRWCTKRIVEDQEPARHE